MPAADAAPARRAGPGGARRTAAAAPVEVPAAEVSDPSQWGRVDDDGTVYVRTADGERAVGSWQAGEPAAGLAHYGRRYDDLATEVALLEARLKAHTGNPGEIKNKAQVLAESIPTAAAVGDLDGPGRPGPGDGRHGRLRRRGVPRGEGRPPAPARSPARRRWPPRPSRSPRSRRRGRPPATG